MNPGAPAPLTPSPINNTLMHEEIIKVVREFLKQEEQITKELGPLWSLGMARGHLRYIADILEQEIQDNAVQRMD